MVAHHALLALEDEADVGPTLSAAVGVEGLDPVEAQAALDLRADDAGRRAGLGVRGDESDPLLGDELRHLVLGAPRQPVVSEDLEGDERLHHVVHAGRRVAGDQVEEDAEEVLGVLAEVATVDAAVLVGKVPGEEPLLPDATHAVPGVGIAGVDVCRALGQLGAKRLARSLRSRMRAAIAVSSAMTDLEWSLC